MTKDENGGGFFAATTPHKYAQKAHQSYTNIKERRPKVTCKLCRTARIIIDEQHRDRDAVQQGQINEAWTQGQMTQIMTWAYEKGRRQLENWQVGPNGFHCSSILNLL